MRTYRKSGFLTVRGIWLQCAALFKRAAWGGCVDYCRRFLSTRITLSDSASSYIWQRVSQSFLSICVTIFWLPFLIHFVLVELVSHCFCVHVCTSLWLFCDVYLWLVVFNSHCSRSLQKQVLLNMPVLKFGWHESTNLLLSFLILMHLLSPVWHIVSLRLGY